MTRALATVRRIEEILPIEGADRIKVATIDGWPVVVGKDEFKVGDLAVYYEIDSFLNAEDPRYAFLEERFIEWNGKRGMRLKTIKLRKQISQGLLISVDKFPEIVNPQEGQDVTELLKIEKWESASEARENSGFAAKGSKGRNFPFFIPKTDQPRVQNIKSMLRNCLDETFEVTIKKDGSSGTFFKVMPNSRFYADVEALAVGKLSWWKKIVRKLTKPFTKKAPIVGICSRNVWLPLEGNTNFHQAAEIAGVENLEGSYAIQGEVVAPDIQENYEKVDQLEFHTFDIFDINSGKYLTPQDRWAFINLYNIPHVTVMFVGKLRDFIEYQEGDDIVQKILNKAEGPSDNPKVKREGLVFKSLERDFSFKAVSNSYLLAKG